MQALHRDPPAGQPTTANNHAVADAARLSITAIATERFFDDLPRHQAMPVGHRNAADDRTDDAHKTLVRSAQK